MLSGEHLSSSHCNFSNCFSTFSFQFSSGILKLGADRSVLRCKAVVPMHGPHWISSRKVIRVESEETQDYVRETLAISQEAADEMGFVPSALSEPRGAIGWCDNRCSERGHQILADGLNGD